MESEPKCLMDGSEVVNDSRREIAGGMVREGSTRSSNRQPLSHSVLDDAYRELQAQAALISDPGLRECFLTRIAENRDIAQAWQLANPQTAAA